MTAMRAQAGNTSPLHSGQATAEKPVVSMRAACLARVSTDDLQDPTLSLPRQYAACERALPENIEITCFFYDVESGRKDLRARGRGHAHEAFDIAIPRAGGITDLLAEAKSASRRFDVVICESIDRAARRTYFGTMIEYELEKAGVPLLAADEPIILSGKRATTILTRRVKQGVAEWWVLETLEKSWDGYCEHTQQGWNIGSPPYGFMAGRVPHPVPAKRAEGKAKTQLVPDPVRAPVVKKIFLWRIGEHLGYQAIADRLNKDLDEHPVPISPDPARQRGSWSGSTVRGILHNPKYTGYQVWNRRATKTGKGKHNAEEEWVWSPDPKHEALVSVDQFVAAGKVADRSRGSRSGADANAHPQTKRSYLFRSLVVCEACGHRMFGKTRRQDTYYACQLDANFDADEAAERFPGHPRNIWVREDVILPVVLEMMATRLFGPERRALVEADLMALESGRDEEHERKIEALRKAIKDLEKRKRNLTRSIELADDPDAGFVRSVQASHAELESEQQKKRDELAGLDGDDPDVPVPAGELLDELPLLSSAVLARAPQPLLRELLEAFGTRFGSTGRGGGCSSVSGWRTTR